ncbi:3-coathanger stack domain-containing protein [Spirosoma pomorum]
MTNKYLKILTVGTIASLASVVATAQTTQQFLRIQVKYEKAGRYLEQATETIEAVNVVKKSASVEYQAGQSVTLLPGFSAESGSTFAANIKAVNRKQETPLQLAAYPNPFDQSTTIEYYLPSAGKVNLNIVDSQGRIVGHLVQGENQEAGKHTIDWKPENAGTGVYFPVVEANQQKAAGRLVKK